MNLKRSLMLMLSLVMCLSLCACGTVNNGTPAAKQNYSVMGAAPAPMPAEAVAYDMAYEEAGFSLSCTHEIFYEDTGLMAFDMYELAL